MGPNKTVRIQKLTRVAVDLVSLALADYGSLAIETLAALDLELFRIGQEPGSRVVVLDLGKEKHLGAGFLRCIAKFRDALKAGDRTLLICGDDRGLFKAIGWGHFIRHYPDILDALNASSAEGQETNVPTKRNLIAPPGLHVTATGLVHSLRRVPTGDTLGKCAMPED